MKNFTLKIAILLCSAFIFFGCNTNQDPVPSGCDFSDADSKAYYDVAMKFANSPTRSNCNTLKQSTLNLIKKFENCDAVTKAQIAQLTQQWNNVDCSAF